MKKILSLFVLVLLFSSTSFAQTQIQLVYGGPIDSLDRMLVEIQDEIDTTTKVGKFKKMYEELESLNQVEKKVQLEIAELQLRVKIEKSNLVNDSLNLRIDYLTNELAKHTYELVVKNSKISGEIDSAKIHRFLQEYTSADAKLAITKARNTDLSISRNLAILNFENKINEFQKVSNWHNSELETYRSKIESVCSSHKIKLRVKQKHGFSYYVAKNNLLNFKNKLNKVEYLMLKLCVSEINIYLLNNKSLI